MARFTMMVNYAVAIVAGKEMEYSMEIDGAVCTVWDETGKYSGTTEEMSAKFPELFARLVKSGWLRAV